MVWMDRSILEATGSGDHLLQFYQDPNGAVGANKEVLVWMATIWCLWKQRNDWVFNTVPCNISEVVFIIKLFSCLWLIIDCETFNKCSFYE